jgi:hypothetical protein
VSLGTDEQHPSGRVGLHRTLIGTLACQYRGHEQPSPRTLVEGRGAFPSVSSSDFDRVSSLCWWYPESGRQKARLFCMYVPYVLAALSRQTESNIQSRLPRSSHIPNIVASQPSCSFQTPPPPLSPPARTTQANCPPTHSNPVSVCTQYVAGCTLSTRTPCFPGAH